ncbi:MAG: hypothetical protein J1D89_06585, partial [Agathobacter sp.]|nr:hypothetical protein [Agathobacter sp.]
GDDLHLTIPHIGDDFLQITIPLDFHAPTSVENLPILSSYLSMRIIPQAGHKINSTTERFALIIQRFDPKFCKLNLRGKAHRAILHNYREIKGE